MAVEMKLPFLASNATTADIPHESWKTTRISEAARTARAKADSAILMPATDTSEQLVMAAVFPDMHRSLHAAFHMTLASAASA